MTGRILIVEDEWVIADEIVEAVEQAGYRIAGPVPTVDEALNLIRTEVIAAALLDLKLGDGDSYPIAECLRSHDIPFAFLTGYNKGEVRPDFQTTTRLTKPVLGAAIAQAVKNLIGAHGASPAAS